MKGKETHEAGVKGVTVMDGIVRTTWLVERGNKKVAPNFNLKMNTEERVAIGTWQEKY